MNNNFLMPKSRVIISTDFPGGSVVKNPPAKAGDVDSIPGLGRSPGEGNGNPLQYSCLENPLDRPGGLQFSRFTRVSCDLMTEQQQMISTHVYLNFMIIMV